MFSFFLISLHSLEPIGSLYLFVCVFWAKIFLFLLQHLTSTPSKGVGTSEELIENIRLNRNFQLGEAPANQTKPTPYDRQTEIRNTGLDSKSQPQSPKVNLLPYECVEKVLLKRKSSQIRIYTKC